MRFRQTAICPCVRVYVRRWWWWRWGWIAPSCLRNDSPPGGRLQLVLMRHPPQLSVKTCGGGGGGGGQLGQLGQLGQGGQQEGWGDIGSLAGGGGLRATHYYHMHTSRGCLGAWGYRGMDAIIAISCLCQEESLKGLKD